MKDTWDFWRFFKPISSKIPEFLSVWNSLDHTYTLFAWAGMSSDTYVGSVVAAQLHLLRLSGYVNRHLLCRRCCYVQLHFLRLSGYVNRHHLFRRCCYVQLHLLRLSGYVNRHHLFRQCCYCSTTPSSPQRVCHPTRPSWPYCHIVPRLIQWGMWTVFVTIVLLS